MADFVLQLLVFPQLKAVLPLPAGQPGGEIALLNLDVGLVDGKNVVDTAVQKGAVLRKLRLGRSLLYFADLRIPESLPEFIRYEKSLNCRFFDKPPPSVHCIRFFGGV